MCERCGAVYRDKHWQRGNPDEKAWPVGLAWTVCPACRQIEKGEYFGRVMILGAAVLRDEEAIRRRIEHVAKRAQFTQPERRILSIERHGRELEVLTTSQKLAHRIANALVSAFGGKASFNWSDRDGELRATWQWEGRSGPKAATP